MSKGITVQTLPQPGLCPMDLCYAYAIPGLPRPILRKPVSSMLSLKYIYQSLPPLLLYTVFYLLALSSVPSSAGISSPGQGETKWNASFPSLAAQHEPM